ncbi:hypothetical protein ACFL03_12635 [Thermodesulfobacteriota bacterium]
MTGKLIKTIDLENNMQLNFYDESRKLAGDRWLVSLVIHMEIPVKEALLHDAHSSTETVEEVEKVLGEKVLFEQKRERIFIDEDDKETVFAELNDNFIARTLKYLSRKSFPKKYVMKMYKEAEKKQ